MSCIYSNIEGECTLFDEGVEMGGHDKVGNCMCEDDPTPSNSCESFECSDCRNNGCEICDEEFEESDED